MGKQPVDLLLTKSLQRWKNKKAYYEVECDDWKEADEFCRITEPPPTLTILTAKEPLRKKFQRDRLRRLVGTIEKGIFETAYEHETVTINNCNELEALIRELESEPYKTIITGEVRKGAAQSISRVLSQGDVLETDRAVVTVDLDGFQTDRPIASLTKEERTQEVKKALDHVGLLFGQDTSFVYQLSASCGLKSEKDKHGKSHYISDPCNLKVHAHILTDRAVSPKSLYNCLKEIQKNHPCVDPSVVRVNQTLLTALPKFLDPKDDPMKGLDRIGQYQGSQERVSLPKTVLCTADYEKAQQEKERKLAEQAKQNEQARKVFEATQKKRTGLPSNSRKKKEEWAREQLDKVCQKIPIANGRHDELYKKSCWIGKLVAGNNGLSYHEAKSRLQGLTESIWGSDKTRVKKEEATVIDGLNTGSYEPITFDDSFNLATTPIETKKEYTHESLSSLRDDLKRETRKGVKRKGKTVITAPVGSGKGYICSEVLIEEKENHTTLVSEPTTKLRGLSREEMKEKHGIIAKEIKARQAETCIRFVEYNAAAILDPKGAARFCGECPFHVRNGGDCSPPKREKLSKGEIGLSTHTLSSVIIEESKSSQLDIEQREIDLHIIDESQGITYHTITLKNLQRLDEITGEGIGELIAKVNESEETSDTFKQVSFQGDELADILDKIMIELAEEGRFEALSLLSEDNIRPKKYPHYKALMALEEAIKEKNYAGIFVYKSTLHIPEIPKLSEVETEILLDATGQPLIIQALYGEHTLYPPTLRPNEFLTHIHIEMPAGSSCAWIDENEELQFETEQMKLVWKALRELFPQEKTLYHTFKKLHKAEEMQADNILYYGGVLSRGSNIFKNFEVSIGLDRRLPRAVIEAHTRLYASMLKAQNFSFDPEELSRQVVEHVEISESIQGPFGRLRPHEAKQEKQKLFITAGNDSKRLAGKFARPENTHIIGPSELLLWAGYNEGANQNTAPYILDAMNRKRETGILKTDLQKIGSVTLSPLEINPKLTSNNPHLQRILTTPQTFNLDKIYKHWQGGVEITTEKGKLYFLPKSQDTIKEEIAHLASDQGWSWGAAIDDKGIHVFQWDELLAGKEEKDSIAYLVEKGIRKRTAEKRVNRIVNGVGFSEILPLSCFKRANLECDEFDSGITESKQGVIEIGTPFPNLPSKGYIGYIGKGVPIYLSG